MGDIFTLNGWIPCEKKLPDAHVDVLISHSHGVSIARWNGRYWCSTTTNMYKTVTAWMPLPEKYKKNKMQPEGEWAKVRGVITPGSDPLWKCSVCGGDEHVMGIETLYNLHHKCKECGSINKYPYPFEKEKTCHERENTNAT